MNWHRTIRNRGKERFRGDCPNGGHSGDLHVDENSEECGCLNSGWFPSTRPPGQAETKRRTLRGCGVRCSSRRIGVIAGPLKRPRAEEAEMGCCCMEWGPIAMVIAVLGKLCGATGTWALTPSAEANEENHTKRRKKSDTYQQSWLRGNFLHGMEPWVKQEERKSWEPVEE